MLVIVFFAFGAFMLDQLPKLFMQYLRGLHVAESSASRVYSEVRL